VRRTSNLLHLIRNVEYNDVNFHLIAISNLDNSVKKIKRWWHSKYCIPPKGIDEYTEEELYIEFLEDYYEKNPIEASRFLEGLEAWEGDTSPEHEQEVLERIKSIGADNVNIAKYHSDNSDYTEDDFRKDMDRIAPIQSDGNKFLGDDDD
jgi:pyruvate-formate lyase-activating enzyme